MDKYFRIDGSHDYNEKINIEKKVGGNIRWNLF